VSGCNPYPRRANDNSEVRRVATAAIRSEGVVLGPESCLSPYINENAGFSKPASHALQVPPLRYNGLLHLSIML
jgi:hypothetical protein